MFLHLLVPVDDSVLSSMNAEVAIELAQRLGSKITFFHAAPDLAATRAGSRLKVKDPEAFEESAFGDTHTLLSQYAVSAETAGVPFEVELQTGDHPAESIVAAARACACDLIVMSSRGARGAAGLFHASQMEKVLKLSPIPVLVTRVAANDPIKAIERVMSVIHDEHRSISAVAIAMRDMVHQAQGDAARLDADCLDAMLGYLAAFPARIHHPKEELYLHQVLRERAPQCGALLETLERQHGQEESLVRTTQAHLKAVRSELGAPSEALFQSALRLSQAIQDHIALEEREVLPSAQAHFEDGDWIRMAPDFESGYFRNYGRLPVEDTRKLFTKIAELHLGAGGHGAKAKPL